MSCFQIPYHQEATQSNTLNSYGFQVQIFFKNSFASQIKRTRKSYDNYIAVHKAYHAVPNAQQLNQFLKNSLKNMKKVNLIGIDSHSFMTN